MRIRPEDGKRVGCASVLGPPGPVSDPPSTLIAGLGVASGASLASPSPRRRPRGVAGPVRSAGPVAPLTLEPLGRAADSRDPTPGALDPRSRALPNHLCPTPPAEALPSLTGAGGSGRRAAPRCARDCGRRRAPRAGPWGREARPVDSPPLRGGPDRPREVGLRRPDPWRAPRVRPDADPHVCRGWRSHRPWPRCRVDLFNPPHALRRPLRALRGTLAGITCHPRSSQSAALNGSPREYGGARRWRRRGRPAPGRAGRGGRRRLRLVRASWRQAGRVAGPGGAGGGPRRRRRDSRHRSGARRIRKPQADAPSASSVFTRLVVREKRTVNPNPVQLGHLYRFLCV